MANKFCWLYISERIVKLKSRYKLHETTFLLILQNNKSIGWELPQISHQSAIGSALVIIIFSFLLVKVEVHELVQSNFFYLWSVSHPLEKKLPGTWLSLLYSIHLSLEYPPYDPLNIINPLFTSEEVFFTLTV